MSYCILFRAVSLKMSDDTYIPVIESGDNNCIDYDGKIARSWDSWLLHHTLSASADAIMEQVKSMVEDCKEQWVGRPIPFSDGVYTEQDLSECLGSFMAISVRAKSCAMSEKEWYAFWARSLRHSVTFAQAAELGIYIAVKWYDEHNKYKSVYVKSEAELRETYSNAVACGYHASVMLRHITDSDYRSIVKSVTPHTRKDDSIYVVSFGRLEESSVIYYVVSKNSHRMSYSYAISQARTFNHSAAARVANSIRKRYSSTVNPSTVTIVKVRFDQYDNLIAA